MKMLGYRFFVPGAFYQVMTHRPDTQHEYHYFETGEIVKCIDIVTAHSRKSFLRHPEFKHEHLVGYFMNRKGVVQVMATGDVRRCRS